jgi:hypothetical protein
VPTGTVDLPTINARRFRCRARFVTDVSTYDRSAPIPSPRCGVPTQMKCTSAKSATCSYDVVNRNRPDARFARSNSSSPGSWNGTCPPDNFAILASSTSKPSTS